MLTEFFSSSKNEMSLRIIARKLIFLSLAVRCSEARTMQKFWTAMLQVDEGQLERKRAGDGADGILTRWPQGRR